MLVSAISLNVLTLCEDQVHDQSGCITGLVFFFSSHSPDEIPLLIKDEQVFHVEKSYRISLLFYSHLFNMQFPPPNEVRRLKSYTFYLLIN